LGSPKAERRVAHARSLLDKIGMGAERLGMTRAADQTTADLIALAVRRAAQVKDLGPNPMKGGSL
jgi:coenzyme F420-reducing hydrogenase delta subunit